MGETSRIAGKRKPTRAGDSSWADIAGRRHRHLGQRSRSGRVDPMTTALLSPAYKLTVGHKLVDTTQKPQASTVVDLTVTLDLDTPADFFRMVLGNADGLKPAIADTVTIELGYDDPGTTQVMSAKVVAVDPGITLTEVIGYSGADALLRTFADKTYQNETA